MANRQPRRNRRPQHEAPTEEIVITAPPLDPMTCAACGVVLPQAMAYAIVKHVGGIATDVAVACSQVCAETTRDKWLGKGEVAPEQHDSDATPAEPQEAPAEPEQQEPIVITIPAQDDERPRLLVTGTLVDLEAMAKNGNSVAEEWLGKIKGAEHEGIVRQLYVIGEMRSRMLSDPRPEARYIWHVLFQ